MKTDIVPQITEATGVTFQSRNQQKNKPIVKLPSISQVFKDYDHSEPIDQYNNKN